MKFKKQPETIKFSEFISGEYKNPPKKKQTSQTLKRAVLPTALMTSVPSFAFAENPVNEAVGKTVREQLLHTFDPLIDLIVTLSYPIAGVMIPAGCILVMVGLKEMGTKFIVNTSIGYVLVQCSPLFLKILVGIGGAI